ncbi:MAG: NPCBM/NEW2 domain-containing protein [Fimbriimonadaceae bacterium]|nr:NPCBM/NEW2 domain-containing protein [Fimbriimonadaceae bacterium]
MASGLWLLVGLLAADPGGWLADDLRERLLSQRQEWGELGLNVAVRPTDGRPPAALQLGQQTYQRGLGSHANSRIVVWLGGEFARFEAVVGVQWQQGTTGSVRFKVSVDDQPRCDSGLRRETDPPLPLRVDLRGGSVLVLEATDGGDGITCDCANWCDARLIRDPQAVARSVEHLDAAPFATVVSSDPARLEGTQANRVTPLPAADLFLTTPVARVAAGWTVPRTADGRGALGLEWTAPRHLQQAALSLASGPLPERCDRWVGPSWWQGRWQPLATPQVSGRRASVDLPPSASGVLRLRWVFAAGPAAVVERLEARTHAPLGQVDLEFSLDRPAPRRLVALEVHNGQLLPATQARQWSTERPQRLRLQYARDLIGVADRTVLRCRTPFGDVALAVDDLLRHGCAWVPSRGLYVRRLDGPTLGEYRRQLAGRRSALAEVAARPEATWAAALRYVHRAHQNNGPLMLSLPADNRKFIVDSDGACGPYRDGPAHPSWVFKVTSLAGPAATPLRRSVQAAGVTYQVTAEVRPVGSTAPWQAAGATCLARYDLLPATAAGGPFRLELRADGGGTPALAAAGWRQQGGWWVWGEPGACRAILQLPSLATARVSEQSLRIDGQLRGDQRAAVELSLPAAAPAAPSADWFPPAAAARQVWDAALAGGATLRLGLPELAAVIADSPRHCLQAARQEAAGQRLAAWISSDRYGPLESEAHAVIGGMAAWGYHDFARRALEFFVHRYRPEGYLTTGYTLQGTGWHLWTAAEAMATAGDRTWAPTHREQFATVARWLLAERAKTSPPDRAPGPEAGLFPPGVAADWELFSLRFYNQGQYVRGLQALVELCGEAAPPGLAAAAAQAQRDLLRAFDWACARTPAVRLSDGRHLPGIASTVYDHDALGDLYPGDDWGRSWCYDVELGAQHLVALGLLPADHWAAAAMAEILEDRWCLADGWHDYPAAGNAADRFHLGGFSKVQPYYTRTVAVHLARDDVKAAVRSYYGNLASLLDRDNRTLWEHFRRGGGWNKTHETGWFLAETAALLVDPHRRLLAPAVPLDWLAAGQPVEVRDLPLAGGRVSFTLRAVGRQVVADVRGQQLPALSLRLRHPRGLRLQRATINGRPAACQTASGIVNLGALAGPVRVVGTFQ